MIIQLFVIFLLKAVTFANTSKKQEDETKIENLYSADELTDAKWDQIQKGQWIVGFFDKDIKESEELEAIWNSVANKVKEFNINVVEVFAPENPGLCCRFLVTDVPKVFYIKNGVAHGIPKVNADIMTDLVSNKNWEKLKPVNFLSNPFSVQMSLLSYFFVHAVNFYNFEDAIVQKFIPISSATDVVFALTFLVVGIFLGLLMTCAFGLVQIYFMDSNETEEESEKQVDEKMEKEKDPSEESSRVRKRK